jgi:hypothetical protein
MWMARLYPRRWQTRYGEEFTALLEDVGPSGRTAFDVLLGALDAHLAALLSQWRLLTMLARLRTSALAVFCAWVAYVLAGLVFFGVLDDNPLTALARTRGDLRLSVQSVQAAAVLGLLAVLVGALPIGWAVLRAALADQRRDILALLAVPVLSAVVIVLYVGVLVVVAYSGNVKAPPSPGNWALVYGFQFVFLLGAVASTAAFVLAVLRSPVAEEVYRFVRLPAALATGAMALTLVGIIVWGIVARGAAPDVFQTTPGVFGLTTMSAWLVVLIGMAAATGVAAISVARGFSAVRD